MKKSYIILSFLMVQIMESTFFAQIIYIPTPKGTNQVEALGGYTPDSPSDIANWENFIASFILENSWQVTPKDGATTAYNCHSYAWYRSEGGIDNYSISAYLQSDLSNFYSKNYNTTLPLSNNVNKYWTDASYSMSAVKAGAKVWYGSCWTWNSYTEEWDNPCDHSAVVISASGVGIYESKWGKYGRYTHPPDHCPWASGTHLFYTINPPVISGSALICSGYPKIFSSSSWLQGNYYWDVSSNLKLSSATTNPTTVTANGSGAGWIKILDRNNKELTRFNVWVGLPHFSLSGPTTSVVGAINRFTLNFTSPSADASTIWSATPGCHEMYFNSTTMADIIFTTVNSQHWVRADVTNTCGTMSYYYHYVDVDCWRACPSCPCQSIIWSPPPPYPNPASETFSIEIDTEAIARGFEKVNGSITCDIRLYDGQGNLLQQTYSKGGKVEFNVTNLPNGIYYLHVYDGESEKPAMHQIVVQH